MQIKRKKLGIGVKEKVDTKIRYYNNIDQTQTEKGSNNFWKIFIILFIILIVIILSITCYRYIYRQVISIFQSLIRRNEANNDDNLSIIKERKNSSAKQRFLRNNICNFSKFRVKNDSQRIKQYEKRCKLKTLLQEKKKLLAPCENNLETYTNNIDVTKQLSLKMSFSSFSSLHIKDVPKSISNKWDIKDPENFETSELSTQNINSIYRNSYQNDKSICFSDTDLKFLIIPLSSKKSDSLNDDMLPYKWDSENINSRRQNNVSSKLIELTFEDTDSLNDNKQKYKIPTDKSTNSLLAKNLATDSKYFSDSSTNKLDTLSNAFLNKLKRSTNSCINSTLSDVSNTIKIANNQILSINSETKNISTCITDKTNGAKKRDKLKEFKSEINLTDAHFKKLQEKMKSSIDILRCNIKEAQNYRKISNSNENFIHTLLIKTDTFRNYIAEPTASEKLVSNNNNNSFISSDNKSEICEIYDELGILFSQYLKLQTQPCQRKYCSLKRYLRQKIQHTTKKCQTRFNYQHVYPYDQRPACNSGNVCIDTYDELKLMCKSSTERKNIYQRMCERRKHFLNQPCILSNQNFTTE